MTRGKKIALGLVLVFATAVTIFALSLSSLVRTQAIAWVAENTNRQLRIDTLKINPFNWNVTIGGLKLTEADGETPFVAFDRLHVDLAAQRSLVQRALVIDWLELDEPYLSIIKTGENRFNFSDLAQPGGDSHPSAESPWGFAINNLAIHGGSADFTDLARPQISHAIRNLELTLPFVGNVPLMIDQFITPQLSLTLDNTPIEAHGELKPFAESLEANLQLKLNDINLASYTPYLPRERPISIGHGRLALEGTLSYRFTEQKTPQVILTGEATLSAVHISDRNEEEVFFLPLARIELREADLLARRALIEQITVYGLKVFVSRDQQGEWNHARMAKDPAFSSAAGQSQEASTPPQVEIGNIRLREGEILFRDSSAPGGFDKDVRGISLNVNSFQLGGGRSDFDLSLQIDEGPGREPGRMTLSGEITMAPFGMAALVKAGRLSLIGLERYLPPALSLRIDKGHVDADLDISLRSGDAMALEARGRIGVRALQLVEPGTESDVLTWESLQLDGLEARFGPDITAVKIKEVALNSFLAKILVTQEGQVNLQKILGPVENAEETGTTRKQDNALAKQQRAASSATRLTIDQVILQDGTVVFLDKHLPTPYTTTLNELGGRVSALSTAAEAPAEVDLRGRLGHHAKLRIAGRLDPLGDALFADLKIRFDTIELTPMTPYSDTYLGYAIAKGKLYLDLDYKVDGSRLEAQNSVFLDQFTFGEHSASEKATKLPVKLAVALLKDRKGEIHLDLPVSGNLDDPQFSVVGVVFRLLKNLLVKAATAPFSLLASLFGSDEDFSTISFSYGKDRLAAPEEIKLSKLGSVLRERPQLKVAVSGYVDREQDPEAYRRAQLEKKIRQARQRALGSTAQDDTAEKVAIEQSEYERYLKQVYKKADFPKPRNVLGLVKNLPREEMEKLILANTQAGETEMRQLAQDRAQTVLDHLVKVEELPAERIFLQQRNIFSPPDDARSGNVVAFELATD